MQLYREKCLKFVMKPNQSLSPFSGRYPQDLLLWCVWEVQCLGHGALGPQPGRPLRHVWQTFHTQDSLINSHTISKCQKFMFVFKGGGVIA